MFKNMNIKICNVCNSKNITIDKKIIRTQGKLIKGRLMSYGYFLSVCNCNDCKHTWDEK